MSTLTIRQLREDTHARLRQRAARNQRSVEAEVRAILDAATSPPRNILQELRHRMRDIEGVELELPDRRDLPRPVDLS